MSIDVSHPLLNTLFVQDLFQGDNKENSSDLHHLLFMKEIQLKLLDSHYQWPVKLKIFPCLSIVISKVSQRIYWYMFPGHAHYYNHGQDHFDLKWRNSNQLVFHCSAWSIPSKQQLISPGAVSLHLVSSPNEFSWSCKFMDDVFMMIDLQCGLCQRFYDVPASLMMINHQIFDTKFATA